MRIAKIVAALLAPSLIFAAVPLWHHVTARGGTMTFTQMFLWYAAGIASAAVVTALLVTMPDRSAAVKVLIACLSAALLLPCAIALVAADVVFVGFCDFEPFIALLLNGACTALSAVLWLLPRKALAALFAAAIVAAAACHTCEYDLEVAAKEGNAWRARLILWVFPNHGDRNEALSIATLYGREDIVRLLLHHGADPNWRQPMSTWTALHCAASGVHLGNESDTQGLLNVLLDAGADANVTDGRGRTPLFYAVTESKDVVQLLLARGARIDHRDRLGATCLHEAVHTSLGNTDMVEFLIGRGADLKATDAGGRTAMHYLTANEHYLDEAMLDFLLARGFDINVRDLGGATPLHYAVAGGIDDLHQVGWYGSADPARRLVARGAHVSAADKAGRTPLHAFAARNLGNEDLLRLLVESGADPAARDARGKTPLDLAIDAGNEGTMALLERYGSGAPAPAAAAQAPSQAEARSRPMPAPTPQAALSPGPSASRDRVDLVEASGIAVRGKGKVAIIGGDETTDRLWAVSLDDFAVRWELVFPAETPMLDDIEALAPCGKHSLFVACAQSRTKNLEKDKPERNRLAFVTLTEDARHIARIRVYRGLRHHLVTHLAGRGRDLFENPGAITMNGPNRGGLNVEGMAWWKDELLLGLRSPVAKGGAVVIGIREPLKLFEVGAESRAPNFGNPLVLPTKPGESIRGMTATDDGILILLGDQTDVPGPGFRLVRWRPDTNELHAVRAKGFEAIPRPEGIALDPQGRLLVVQDQRLPLPKKILFRLQIEKP